MTIDKEQFIKIFPSFKEGPEKLGEDILSASIPREFKKNGYLYTEGDVCAGIGLFLCGEVRVFKIAESGREITLYEMFPGDTCILNASSILSKVRYPANAVCITDGSLLYLPKAEFLELISEHEAMRKFIFNFFSQRLAAIIEVVEEVTFGKMDHRLMEYVIEKSENGSLSTTHQNIANDLGTSREVVSRLLKDFERKGEMILSRGKIELKIF